MALIFTGVAAPPVWSAPISFNTALPVARGEGLLREQVVVDQQKFAGLDVTATTVAGTLGYGLDGDTAVFADVPWTNKSSSADAAGALDRRDTRGVGDATAFLRRTVFRRDRAARTFRLAPFAGLTAPTGEDDAADAHGRLPLPLQTGTGVWSGFAGLVATRQTLDWEADAQALYRRFGRDSDRPGDVFRFGASLQLRLLPRSLSGARSFTYGVLEAGAVHQGRGRAAGAPAQAGGTQVFLAPGLQWVGRRWVLETLVQAPVAQNLRAFSIRERYAVRSGFRWTF